MPDRGELRPGGRYAFLFIALFVALGLSAASVLAARPSEGLNRSTSRSPLPTSKRTDSSLAPEQPAGADTSTPTATATPSLISVDVSPAVAEPGSSITLSYTVYSPNAQQVSLGAGIRPTGTTNFSSDPANDRTLSIPAGQSEITRTFELPLDGNITYD